MLYYSLIKNRLEVLLDSFIYVREILDSPMAAIQGCLNTCSHKYLTQLFPQNSSLELKSPSPVPSPHSSFKLAAITISKHLVNLHVCWVHHRNYFSILRTYKQSSLAVSRWWCAEGRVSERKGVSLRDRDQLQDITFLFIYVWYMQHVSNK